MSRSLTASKQPTTKTMAENTNTTDSLAVNSASADSFDADFIWKLLRDAERGLNRCGIYAEVELGGVCYEVQKAQNRMKEGDFSKARKMLNSFNRRRNSDG